MLPNSINMNAAHVKASEQPWTNVINMNQHCSPLVKLLFKLNVHNVLRLLQIVPFLIYLDASPLTQLTLSFIYLSKDVFALVFTVVQI